MSNANRAHPGIEADQRSQSAVWGKALKKNCFVFIYFTQYSLNTTALLTKDV